jgi:radical SAM superfamily enzyme YgiQ (UPF0313 family)
MTLATIVNTVVGDTLMYSESISKIDWDDIFDADIVFIGIFTFNAQRGYQLARLIREKSKALVIMGGLHASMNYPEAVRHCDYVLLGEGDESILECIHAANGERAFDFQGLAYLNGNKVICTGDRKPPQNINVIPTRDLLYRYHRMAGHNTLWLQVHASRGCPHHCDYCAVVRHFGQNMRMRTPENIVEDVRQSIAFHRRKLIPRLTNVLWFTDDNFFADRAWAISVLKALIDSGIRYHFTVQARYEVGFDDEMLVLMKQAGFLEVAIGIEFLEDEAFEEYHKKCSYSDILKSVRNIQKHGLSVRGLFIVGAANHAKGVGDKLADFVIDHDIRGVLIQSMYFVPGTPAYEKNKDRLIHQDWSKYTGNVVHHPQNIAAYDLQKEIIHASQKIYSRKRLFHAMLRFKGINKLLFIGEYFWHKNTRARLKKELALLEHDIKR